MSSILFKLSINHQYYQDGVIPELDLIPDPSTQEFLTRYRLILQKIVDSYSIHYFGPNDFQAFKQSLPLLLDNQPLRFILKGQNRSFYVITELPVDWRGDINFDTGSQAKSEKIGLASSKHLIMQLDNRQLSRGDELGAVSIHPNDLQKTQNFSIQFQSRKTHWHYLLFNRSGIKLYAPEIKNQQGLSFQKPEKILAENGEQGLLFSSGQHAFFMQERPKHCFQLLNSVESKVENKKSPFSSETLLPETKASQRVLLKQLPFPAIDKISINHHGEQPRVYSQMYVYL